MFLLYTKPLNVNNYSFANLVKQHGGSYWPGEDIGPYKLDGLPHNLDFTFGGLHSLSLKMKTSRAQPGLQI